MKFFSQSILILLIALLFAKCSNDDGEIESDYEKIIGKWQFSKSYFVNKQIENPERLAKCLRKSSYTFLNDNVLYSEFFVYDEFIDDCIKIEDLEKESFLINNSKLSLISKQIDSETMDTITLDVILLDNTSLILKDFYISYFGEIPEKDKAIYEFVKIN